MPHLRAIRLKLFLLTLLLALPMLLQAQSGLRTFINYFVFQEEEDALNLQVYFNLVDSGGRVVEDVEAESVNVQVDGQQYTANTTQPDSPFYIAMVLDASGSMTSANPDMRAAAQEAVDSAPEQARFAVMSFSERENIELIQDFTPDSNRTKSNIDEVRSIPNGGTCLYDAAYQAIQRVNDQPPGRRAVILFTDGVDETASGETCSQNTLADVLSFATQAQSRVPLYVVGMSGTSEGSTRINTAELRRMAQETGGISAIGQQADLTSLFDTLMTALNNQWLAQVDIYPTAGQHQALLTPVLDDGTRAATVGITINASRDFTPPMVLSPGGVTYDVERDITTIRLSAQGAERADSLVLEVIDQETNLTEETLTVSGVPNEVEIPGENLTAEHEYIVRINGQNADGQPTMEQPLEVPFVYNPPPGQAITEVQSNILGIQLTENRDQVRVNMNTLGASQVKFLELSLVDAETQTIVPDSTIRTNGTPSQASLPTEGLERGREYVVSVTPYDQDDQPIPDGLAERGFTFGTPTAPPELFIAGVDHEPGTTKVSLSLIRSNVDSIDTLQLSVISAENNVNVVDPIPFDSVPQTMEIPTENLADNREYILRLTPLDRSGNIVIEPVETQFLYEPPGKSLLERVGDFVANPIVLAIVLALAGIILFVLFSNRRKQQPQQAGQAANPQWIDVEPTNIDQNQKVETIGNLNEGKLGNTVTQLPPTPPTGGKQSQGPPKPPTPPPPPSAEIIVMSATTHIADPKVSINRTSFIVGREGKDLNFDDDTSVSRHHLEIQYLGHEGVYTVRDLGSSYGSKLDGKRLGESAERLPKDGEARLDLGTSVSLKVRITQAKPANDQPDADWSPT